MRDFQGTTMASPIGCLTTLDYPKYVETCFEALDRATKLRDRRSEGEQNEITDIFLATAGCEAIQKVSTMAYPRNLEDLTFKEICEVIKSNIRPKKRLVIVKITKVQEKRQHPMSLLYNLYTDGKKELDIENLKDLAPVKWPQKIN